MSLELAPQELGFRRPFDQEVSQVLRLQNTSNGPIAFKVKTTAPKQYCVRPNSGKVEAGESVEVSVVLQPMRQDPPADARCKDKFLVQSVSIPSDGSQSWADIEKTNKSKIQERKIRVFYLPASTGAEDQPTNGVSHDNVDDSVASVAPPSYTPRAESSTAGVETPSSTRATEKSSEDRAFTPSSTKENTSAPVAAAIETREYLREQLANANETIAQLKRDAEAGLRKRNVNTESVKETARSAATTLTQPQGQAGVPVATVALIALFVFLLTYFLF